jgi:hypothetical protein
LKRRLYGSTAGEPAPKFYLVDRLLVAALGYHGEIVKVLKQLLVLGDGEDNGCSLALGVCLVLRATRVHFERPPCGQCSTARTCRLI